MTVSQRQVKIFGRTPRQSNKPIPHPWTIKTLVICAREKTTKRRSIKKTEDADWRLKMHGPKTQSRKTSNRYPVSKWECYLTTCRGWGGPATSVGLQRPVMSKERITQMKILLRRHQIIGEDPSDFQTSKHALHVPLTFKRCERPRYLWRYLCSWKVLILANMMP